MISQQTGSPSCELEVLPTPDFFVQEVWQARNLHCVHDDKMNEQDGSNIP